MFAQLVAFKRRHGHVDGPFRVHHPALSQWVTKQRRQYRARELPRARVERLERLGLKWEGKLTPEELLERDVEALVRFRKERGHFHVMGPDGLVLFNFVRDLRRGVRRLPRAQRITLELLGFPGSQEAWLWETRFGTLTERVREGKGFEVGEPSQLGPWIKEQRRLASEGRLQGQRALRLETLGLFRPENQPLDRRALAQERRDARFTQQLAVWSRSKERTRRLKEWELTQRKASQKGTLSAFRLSKLRAAGFEFRPSRPKRGRDPRSWEAWYQQLARFARLRGHTRVLRTDRQFPGLGSWVSKVRVERNQGKLTAKELRALDKLGFEWRPWDRLYEEMLGRLRRWSQAHGHGNVTGSSKDAAPLGKWLKTMRRMRSRGELSAEREAQLAALGVYWTRAEARLARRVEWLERFKARHGRWPMKFTESVSFVRELRSARARGLLPAGLEARLNQRGFDWDEPERIDDERLSELKAHYRAHGHHAVPDVAPWRALWEWMDKVRQRARRKELSRRLRHNLTALDFPFDRFEIEWERGFALAVTYHRGHGHLRVTGEGALAVWLAGQRSLLRSGVLDGGREDRLRDLDEDWASTDRSRRLS